jgi:hypothetical protein
MKNAGQPSHLKMALSVGAAVALVAMLWLFWARYGVRWIYSLLAPPGAAAASVGELGQVGDLFGGVNALFAAVAVVGVFWAGYMQRQSLIETRHALAEERAGMVHQQFEGTFFQLVTLFRSVLVDSCVLELPFSPPLIGSGAVDFDGAVRVVLGDEPEKRPIHDEAGWEQAFSFHALAAHRQVFEPNKAKIEPLFRTLAAVFEHVQRLEFSHPNEVLRYSEIMRDQLSDSFLILFSLYAKTYNVERFIHLIYRFFLLAPIRHGGFSMQLLVEAYGPEAVGMSGSEPSEPFLKWRATQPKDAL